MIENKELFIFIYNKNKLKNIYINNFKEFVNLIENNKKVFLLDKYNNPRFYWNRLYSKFLIYDKKYPKFGRIDNIKI